MAQHTPGPWLAASKPSSVSGWPIVQQGVGRLICSVNYVQHSAANPKVAGDDAFNREAAANARLIAAAPDMLAALKECALQIAQNHGRRLTADEEMALDAARAAIAKATGASA